VLSLGCAVYRTLQFMVRQFFDGKKVVLTDY
jgi:hypothetical protein